MSINTADSFNTVNSSVNLQLQVQQAKQAEASMQNSGDLKKLEDSCQQFEAMFVKIMLDSMKSTVQKSGLIDGGMAENIFEDMLYDEYAQEMSKTGNLGIGKMMYDQLKPSDSILMR